MPGREVVTVKVTDQPASGSRKRTVTVALDKDPFYLGGMGFGNAGAGAPITWQLDITDASGWTFNDGISIAAPQSHFGNGTLAGNKLTYNCNRLYADNATRKYSISVTDGNIVIVIDPTIINQP